MPQKVSDPRNKKNQARKATIELYNILLTSSQKDSSEAAIPALSIKGTLAKS